MMVIITIMIMTVKNICNGDGNEDVDGDDGNDVDNDYDGKDYHDDGYGMLLKMI